ncbi:MAG: ATP-dependent helicase [Candidatus Competibacteraceae bacterium]|nr:ATP-dependent helicase [Candidatus Competibacteraceae bacterium]
MLPAAAAPDGAVPPALPATNNVRRSFSCPSLYHYRLNNCRVNKKFEGEDVSLHQLLHELGLTSKTPPKPSEAIPCFTIHASKGMEFRHVYLMGLVEDQLPSWTAVKKGDNSLEMQEERRNCFVAITRTQETLTMTFSAQVFGWVKQPSRFLREMGIEL